MNKKNQILITILIILIVVGIIFSIIFFARKKNNIVSLKIAVVPKEVTLFYSAKCMHCRHVEAFLKKNRLTIHIKKLDVLKTRQNLLGLVKAAEKCGFQTKTLEIPFLWTGSKCFVGDKDVIHFFKGFKVKTK